MAIRKASSQLPCCGSLALSFSSPLLFLSIILPRSSFAQVTSPSSSAIPTTLQTSTFSNPSPSSSASTTPTNDPPPNDDDGSSSLEDTSSGPRTFNYYFVIVAVAALLFCLALLYFGKRKKQKAALMRRNSQRALAQDVAGFGARTRGGRARNNGRNFWNTRRENESTEGLDERGEAPPPYVPGGKPPSIRTATGSGDYGDRRASHSAGGESVELNALSSSRPENTAGTANTSDAPPPGYHEHTGYDGEDIGDIARPQPAVTTTSRHEPS